MTGLGKPFRKSIKKVKKLVEIKAQMPYVNKKPLAKNRNFVQTPFSHST